MEKVMICLVGEQPMPNLLPIRYDAPGEVLLVYTEETNEVKKRLEKVLSKDHLIHSLEVSPYNIPDIKTSLQDFIQGRGWQPTQLVFNLTGGTKAMAFAAYSLARDWGAKFIYVESEEKENRAYRYYFENGEAYFERDEVIPEVITLDDYLKAHLGAYILTGFSKGEGGKFEEAVYKSIAPEVNEIKAGVYLLGQIDIDLIFRYHNQVGIAEVKTGKKATKADGIRQLEAASPYLDLYVKKLLIVDRKWDKTLEPLKGWAKAAGIEVIEIPGYDSQKGEIPSQDQERLRRKIRELFKDNKRVKLA